MNDPETLETQQVEKQPVEKAPEIKEENIIRGAEILENPPDGGFVQGLQVFIAWVKTLVADKD